MSDKIACMKRLGATTIAATAGIVLALAPAWANQPVTGADFTTVNEAVDGSGHCQNGNPNVNCNIYDGKEFVWLTGGPGTSALGDGTYVFAVLEPGGQGGNQNPNDCTDNNLSDTAPCGTTGTGAGDDWTHRVFSIAGGVITYPAAGYAGGHDFNGNKIRLMPYDDTPNPGGVYILAICSLADAANLGGDELSNPPGVDPSDCKYDAFKAPTGTPPEPEELGNIEVLKYCDLNMDGSPNRNGSRDPLEPGLANWGIQVDSGATCDGFTDPSGLFACTDIASGSHLVSEADVLGWTHTGTCVDDVCTKTSDNSVLVDVITDGTTDVDFGNVRFVACGGKTKGYWTNSNGQAKLTAAALCGLNDLNLVKADGSAFDPIAGCPSPTSTQLSAGKAALKSWLNNATATNMAYMLSAQMAASYLDQQLLSAQDVFQLGGITIPAACTGLQGIVDVNVISIGALITEANSELAAYPVTVTAGDARTCEEAKKIIFDTYNNAGESGTPVCNACSAPQ